MSTTTTEPVVTVEAREDGTATVTVDGMPTELRDDSLRAVTTAAVRHVASVVATPYGAPVTVTAYNPHDGKAVLQIAPSGKVTELPQAIETPQPVAETQPTPPVPTLPAADAAAQISEPIDTYVSAPAIIDEVPTAAVLPAGAPVEPIAADVRPREEAPAARVEEQEPTPPPSRRSLRETTFLTTDAVIPPATKGPRSLLRFVGMKVEPSAAELAERDDIAAVSQHWAGPRTIKVANRKGGSNKTPTVAALSAVFARFGGGGVLAWDNNENQGTLGWRTEEGRHGASVLDLLRDENHLMAPTASQGLMAGYVHHQQEDRYDVLRSDENNEGDHEIQADEVHRAHAIAERYYRLILMDSGNTLRAANWRAAASHADQLVVPTTTMEDRAEAAKLTLQTLEARDEHSAQLAANAVVIISQWKPEDRAEAQRIAELFTPLVRAVQIVPYDPALKAGRIRFSALKPNTQRAWLAAAAAVARGL